MEMEIFVFPSLQHFSQTSLQSNYFIIGKSFEWKIISLHSYTNVWTLQVCWAYNGAGASLLETMEWELYATSRARAFSLDNFQLYINLINWILWDAFFPYKCAHCVSCESVRFCRLLPYLLLLLYLTCEKCFKYFNVKLEAKKLLNQLHVRFPLEEQIVLPKEFWRRIFSTFFWHFGAGVFGKFGNLSSFCL